MNLKNKIRRLGLKLFKSQIILSQKISLADNDGKILKSYEKISDSLTGNFLQSLYAFFSGNNTSTWAITAAPLGDGSQNMIVHTIDNLYVILVTNNYYLDGIAGDTNHGIVFGSGITPVTPADYKIETLIPHGLAANQLSYLGMSAPLAPTITGNSTKFKLLRMATNSSGANVTVNEVAIYIQVTSIKYMCIYRDLVTPALVVPNGLNAIAEITWEIIT